MQHAAIIVRFPQVLRVLHNIVRVLCKILECLQLLQGVACNNCARNHALRSDDVSDSGWSSSYKQEGKLEEKVDDFAEGENRGPNDEAQRSTNITHQRLDRVRRFRLNQRIFHLREKYLHNTRRFSYIQPNSHRPTRRRRLIIFECIQTLAHCHRYKLHHQTWRNSSGDVNWL